MKRKFVKTDYNQVILREDDKIIHLDAEALAELYWEVKDKKLVRVVNCKDCKFYNTPSPMKCRVQNRLMLPWAYCSEGEHENAETYETKPGVQIKI